MFLAVACKVCVLKREHNLFVIRFYDILKWCKTALKFIAVY